MLRPWGDGPRDTGLREDDPTGAERQGAGWPRTALRVGAILLCLVAFLLAVRLLGVAGGRLAPILRDRLQDVLSGHVSALGAGWLFTYVLTNGSVVAALAVALFASGVFDGSVLLLTVAGTRLGSAGFVVLLGGIDWLRRRASIQQALGLGLLTFVVTHTIYLPTTAVAYALRGSFERIPVRFAVLSNLDMGTIRRLRDLSIDLVEAVGSGPAIATGFLLLFGSLYALDRVLTGFDEERLVDGLPLARPWLAFLAGIAVTTATASISFSVGAAVPLYIRGYVGARSISPYILGANVATLFDTILAGIVLRHPAAVATLVGLTIVVTIFTLLAMAFYDRYFGVVEAIMDWMTSSRRAFAVSCLGLLLAPIGITAVSLF